MKRARGFSDDQEAGRDLRTAALLIGVVLFCGAALNLLGALRALMD